jgi:hypothetical protein
MRSNAAKSPTDFFEIPEIVIIVLSTVTVKSSGINIGTE